MDDDTRELCTPYTPIGPNDVPLEFDPAWRSETVTALAKGIDADVAFDRLPILADALEEAGCDHPEVLNHCRRCTLHHPRCWVLNLALDRPADPFPPFPEPTPVIIPQPSPPPAPPRGGVGGQASSGLPPLFAVFVALNLFRLCAGGLPSNTPSPPPKYTPPPRLTVTDRLPAPAADPMFEKWLRGWEASRKWNATPTTEPTPSGKVIPAGTIPTGR